MNEMVIIINTSVWVMNKMTDTEVSTNFINTFRKKLSLFSAKDITFTMASAQSPNYMNDDCHNSTTQQALTLTYQTNLHNTLLWLSSDAATSKGYNHTTTGNGTVDAVYGLYDCRGDVTGSFCQFCVSTAASEILQRCPNKSSAVIWYNYCILR